MSAVQIPILMYHSISDGCAPRFRRFAVSPHAFRAHARFLSAHGFQSLTVSELVAALDGEAALPAKPVVLTFDDGFADFHEAALPILVEFGLTATLYVVSGRVGRTSSWLAGIGEGERRLVGWEQLDEISRSGIEIGAHSVTHAALDLLPLEAAKEEIAVSKRDLEDRLGTRIASFAYPFGYHNGDVRGLVEDQGYASACAVRYAMSSPADDRFALARHIALDGWDRETLSGVLAGHPPMLPNFYDQTRSSAWRAVRQSVRRFYQ
jgi:peptidoglycan/xylan/chitin deacetylase (PgdA/CDA1 family)